MEQATVHNGSMAREAPLVELAEARQSTTPEGMALAYGSLVFMALLPIFFGALRSASCTREKNASDTPELITSQSAAFFPILLSCILVGHYLFFKLLPEEYISLMLSTHFFVFVVLALSRTISPTSNKFFPASFSNKQYQLLFIQDTGKTKGVIMNYKFDTKDLVLLATSSIWYLLRKHWVVNNLLVLAISLSEVQLLHLNNISTGCVVLSSFLIYDIFQVFCTNTMVMVAGPFVVPVELAFPQDLLEKGLEASDFATLGLGDVDIPGIFIALLLHFDISLKKNIHTYFYTGVVAYIFGLWLMIFIMHMRAQPALLYLVPACIGFPVLVALAKGELAEMFNYEDTTTSKEVPGDAKERKTEVEKKEK